MKKFLKPALGPDKKPLVVRHPFTKDPLPPEGREIELNSYWRRRLEDGDVVESTPVKPEKPAKKEK